MYGFSACIPPKCCDFIFNFRTLVSILSWLWGPVVTLQDCLAAFFARDELKGKPWGVNLL